MPSAAPQPQGKQEMLPHNRPSQAEGLLLDPCTINDLLMAARSICRNNLYLSHHTWLRAEPGALSRAPAVAGPNQAGQESPTEGLLVA